jgi:ribonuclease BN (tRNA processing enzyme)
MMTLNFYGVRGSYPAADRAMMKYGGNTSCVEIVKANDQGLKVPVIIDAGSGIISFGYALGKRILSKEYSPVFPMLFTHTHPDHTEGFNFFTPIFFPFCKIYILGMKAAKKSTGDILRQKARPPVFPVEYRDFKAALEDRVLRDGQTFYITQEGEPVEECENPLFKIETLRAFAPSHPQQGALYYRISDTGGGETGGSTVACIWDNESHSGGDARVINFAHGADLMIHDTQYSDDEYQSRKNPVQGFGHSSYSMAMENARESEVKYFLSFHYSPRHTDAFLDGIEKKYSAAAPFEFIMAREGLSLTLKDGKIEKQKIVKLALAP